jgi:hypothetical protein
VCSIFKGGLSRKKTRGEIVGVFFLLTPPMMMEQTWRYETSAHKIQMPGNHPKKRTQRSEQGKV